MITMYVATCLVPTPARLNLLNNIIVQFESSRKQLRKWSVLRKRLTDINAYRKKHTDLDESLLSIIEEKDQVSFPEERVLAIKPRFYVSVNEILFESDNCICITIFA